MSSHRRPSHHDVPPVPKRLAKFYEEDNAPAWINDLTLNKPDGTSPSHIVFLRDTSASRSNAMPRVNPPWGVQYDALMQPFSAFSRRPDLNILRPFSALMENRKRIGAKEEQRQTDEEWLAMVKMRNEPASGSMSPTLANTQANLPAGVPSYEVLLDQLEERRARINQAAGHGGPAAPIPGMGPTLVAATNFERLTTPGGGVMFKRVKGLSAPVHVAEENRRLKQQVAKLQEEVLRVHVGVYRDRYARPVLRPVLRPNTAHH